MPVTCIDPSLRSFLSAAATGSPASTGHGRCVDNGRPTFQDAFPAVARCAARTPHQENGRMRLLLAEDTAQLSTWLARALRQSHFAVDCLRDRAEADRSLASEDYDAVILDLNLPRIDGLEVLRRLRQRGSRTPVL